MHQALLTCHRATLSRYRIVCRVVCYYHLYSQLIRHRLEPTLVVEPLAGQRYVQHPSAHVYYHAHRPRFTFDSHSCLVHPYNSCFALRQSPLDRLAQPLYVSPTADVVDTVTEQFQRSLYTTMAQSQRVQHADQSRERMASSASSHSLRSHRHRLATVLAPISLSGHMGDFHGCNLAELWSAPLVPSTSRTSWTLSGWCGIGLDGLVSKIYDKHGEQSFELVLDISNSKGGSPFPQSSISFYTP